MKHVIIFFSLFFVSFGFAQSQYQDGAVYKINNSLSLKCDLKGFVSMSLYEANRPEFSTIAATYPQDLTYDEINEIERRNLIYDKFDIINAFIASFTNDEIKQFAANKIKIHLGVTIDDMGNLIYISFTFPRKCTDLTSLSPDRFGALYMQLINVKFRPIDRRLKYSNGGFDVNFEDVKRAMEE
ncbi:hypothetical protein [Alistipes timonensis]|uniref:hypothetical protein n=1 Tax=Alistipes timonensis TaxID=1465754 RepID=UPI00267094E5|nr:hypothetical protein [Alistipes timonensis]